MGEYDVAGFDDSDESYTEIDTSTAEHVRHSAYWALSTDRGQDWEEPSRWADLFSFLEARSTAAIAQLKGAAARVAADLEETDSRIKRAVYSVIPGEVTRWIATLTTTTGSVTAEGELQPLPQDVEQEEEAPLPDPGPVAAGFKTLRQLALEGGLFPAWVLGPNFGKVVYAFGLLMDMSTEWLVQGIQQRFPLVCDEGALPWLSRDLGIRRGYRESNAAFRIRLSKWATTWARAGIPFAIAEQAQAYFWPQVPRVHVIQYDPGAGGKPTRTTWSTRHHDGSETTTVVSPANVDWDSADPSRPASLDTRDPRLFVVVEQPAGDADALFAVRSSTSAATRDPDGMNGCVRPGGGQVPADQYRDLRDIALDWRELGTWVALVAIYFGTLSTTGTGAEYPDGTWYDPLNDTKDGNRISSNYRILYLNPYPGNRLPESPAPYP